MQSTNKSYQNGRNHRLASRWAKRFAVAITAARLSTGFAAIFALVVVCGGVGDVEGAETVASWDFSRRDDLNFDNQADGWKRTYDRTHPRYLRLEIVPKDPQFEQNLRVLDSEALGLWQAARRYLRALPPLPPSIADMLSDRYLRGQVDGGGIVASSPEFDVLADYSYRLTGQIKTEGLTFNRAWVELEFLDRGGETLEVVAGQKLAGTNGWARFQIGPTPPPTGATRSRAVVRYEPTERADRADLGGMAGFDNLVIERLPRIQLEDDGQFGLYEGVAEPKIRCLVSGLRGEAMAVEFVLFDEAERALATKVVPLKSVEETDNALGFSKPLTVGDSRLGGVAMWEMESRGPGFYRVRARLAYQQTAEARTLSELGTTQNGFSIDHTFAVLGNLPLLRGPFGWSMLSPERRQIPTRSLPDWLRLCRVQWFKYPCWVEPNDYAGADELAWLAGRLEDREIQMVGVLCDPPEAVIEELNAQPGDPSAILLRDPALWQPMLEPMMTRLSNGVRWWQLGDDFDHSFLGRAQLKQTIDEIRAGLQGFGQPIQLVLNWPWLDPLPPPDERSWQKLMLGETTPMTADEIKAYFNEDSTMVAVDEEANPRPWVMLAPLPRDQYSRADRIRDLVLRMLAVRSSNIPAAFVSDPFDPAIAMLRKDGSPDEMLLPWRTAASLLGAIRPVGSLELPGESQNVVLADDASAMMVVWSQRPVDELVYVGREARQIDAYGREVLIEQVEHRGFVVQKIKVTAEPTFIINLDRTAALWRMAVRLDKDRIDSLLGREQELNLIFRNPSSQSLSGTFRIHAPEAWAVSPSPRPLTAEPLTNRQEPFSITLRGDATIGREAVAIDFELDGDQPRQFTVWRFLEVGSEDIKMEVTTRLLPDGRLMIRQELTNLSAETMQFDCYVYAPGRRRQRRTVTVDPGKTVVQEFVWFDAETLIGETMLLRAEQQGGARTLNYRFQGTR